MERKHTKINSIKHIEQILEAYRKLILDEKRKQQLNYQFIHHTSFLDNFKKLYSFQRKYDDVLLNTAEKNDKNRLAIQLKNEFSMHGHHFNVWLVEKLGQIAK